MTYAPGVDEGAVIIIFVAPTEAPVNQSVEVKRRMAKIIADGTAANAAQMGNELIHPPTLEKDDQYFMRLRSTYKTKGAALPTEQLTIYRVVGLSLAAVTITATTETPGRAEQIFKLGENICDSLRNGNVIRPSGFPRARVWITAPLEWNETKTDTPAGPLVTYRDPRDANNIIRVGVRPMTKDAKADTGVRQKSIDALVQERDKQFQADGLTEQTDLTPAPDARFVIILASDFTGKPGPRHVETRVLIVGDSLLAVTTSAPADRPDALAKVTDELIASIKPIERK